MKKHAAARDAKGFACWTRFVSMLFCQLGRADSFRLNPGSIVAMDRGYIDYALFARWSMSGVFFVTRLKNNAAFEVAGECGIPQNRNIRLTGAKAQADYPDLLRRIVAWDAEYRREVVLLANLLEFGSSENALRIQIWTALIALLLVKWLRHLSQANWSLSNLASMPRHVEPGIFIPTSYSSPSKTRDFSTPR